ncbi:MAG TPA: hypothetical protein VK779_10920 [Rhizomicrobium sp.]|jgi:hypothetical protein|nr:hypothetical protein [Rhizomicrobium sp.]
METHNDVRLPQRSQAVVGTEAKNAISEKAKPTKKETDRKVDRQLKDSFPASDPPSYSGGRHIIGAPEERESGAAQPHHPEVKAAEKKVKDGTAKHPAKY